MSSISSGSKEIKILKLEFNKLKFDCIIALDGILPPKQTMLAFGKIPLLAADGAAISLLKKSISADYVIGDLDTFQRSKLRINFKDEKLIYLPSQEQNDFEKTLSFAKDSGYKNILIIGFHGGELEHTLNNWSVLKKFSRKLNLCLFEGNRYGIPLSISCTFKAVINEMISLIPQPSALITSENLKWNLNNEILELGTREGARNIAISENVTIQIHSGELLLFINSRIPFAPEFV